MSPDGSRWLARFRSLVTLVVLALLVVVGISWGWSSLTAPFGTDGDVAVCTENTVEKGEILRLEAITVNVLNAGGRAGLAGRTRDQLVAQGFGEGRLANAPSDVEVRVTEIWAAERTPAFRLVRSHLQGKVRFRKREGESAGLAVVVGDGFRGVKKGKQQLTANRSFTVCSPPGLA